MEKRSVAIADMKNWTIPKMSESATVTFDDSDVERSRWLGQG
jgi:hypothetical protein